MTSKQKNGLNIRDRKEDTQEIGEEEVEEDEQKIALTFICCLLMIDGTCYQSFATGAGYFLLATAPRIS